ncbi:MAG: PqqD family protein [Acidobacteria bacterium]|nr:MAG: PqqD family protein [Acidobacteriota bacterium]
MPFEITDSTVVEVAENQVSGELVDGEIAILNLNDGVYYGLNAVGGRVWRLIQKRETVKGVMDTLLDEFDVEPERCRTEVIALLTTLAERNLVKINGDFAG